jgi:diguanylate cyclase (GGDEF)-like protein/PAS domain S-box-containing protein
MQRKQDNLLLEQDAGRSEHAPERRDRPLGGHDGLRILNRPGARDSAGRFLDALINAIPSPVVVKDDQHRFVAVNAALCAFLGRTSAQILGKTDYDFFRREDARFYQATDSQVLEQGEMVEYERSYTLDGATGWMHVRKTRLIAPDGSRLVVLLMMDVTKRRVAEEALRQSEARFRSLTELSADWYWEQDEELRVTFLSQQADYKSGYAGLNSRGLTRWDHPGVDKSSADWEAHKQTCLAHRPFRDFVYRRVDPNGTARWLSISGEPVFDADGRFKGYRGVGTDVTAAKKTQDALTLERNLLRALIDHMPDFVHTKNEQRQYVLSNARNLQLLGVDTEADAAGKTVFDFFPPELAELYDADDREVLATGQPILAREEPVIDSQGERRWSLITKVPLRDLDGRTTGLVCISRDITSLKAVQDSLVESQAFLEHSMAVAEIGTWASGLGDDDRLKWSLQTCAIFGVRPEEFDGKVETFFRMVHAEDRDAVKQAVELAIAGQDVYQVDHRVVRGDGAVVRWVHERAQVVRDAAGKPLRLVGVVQDITARKEAEEQLLRLAHYDKLTQLPNRTLFHDRLLQSLSHSRHGGRAAAVIFVDLDHFKLINDTLGHPAGDQLLQQVARRLEEAVRTGDTVGRLGGDEFAVVLSDMSAVTDADGVAQKLMEALAQPFILDGREVFVNASAGITLFPTDSEDPDTLLKYADAAMYRAKELGRGNYQFYRSEMNARSLERMSIEGHLRRALERNEFLLHYQPKIDLASSAVTGVEALLRWNHPELGLVSPARFVPILEDNGLIVQVGEWVLREACRQIEAWRAGGVGMPVAVNLSVRQLQQLDLHKCIERIVSDAGIEPGLIELEITESMLMRNPEHAAALLRYLKDLGIRLSMDDFGTGYSSLSYLKRFPVDRLKIDRSFVRDIASDHDDAAIVQSIIAMGHALGLKVIAEGVETAEQLAFLKTARCDEAQGYYFSKPILPDEIPCLDAELHTRTACKLR